MLKFLKKKELIFFDILEKVIDLFGDREKNCDLCSVRIIVMLFFGFVGFFRFNEFVNIKVKNIIFKDLYMNICVEISKIDVYRCGNEIIIVKIGGKLCFVLWIKYYLLLVEIENNLEDYIFRVVCFYKFFEKYMFCKINKFILYIRV